MSEARGYGENQSQRDVLSKAKDIGSEFQQKAAEMSGDVAGAAKEQLAKLGSTAKELADDATSKAQAALEEQRSLGAQYISSLAGAVERAAGEFEGPMPVAAQYLKQAAEQIDIVASNVETRNLRELVTETEQFARRQPALFFGGAMLLGFAALRFLKSAPAESSSDGTPEVQSPPMAEFGETGRGPSQGRT